MAEKKELGDLVEKYKKEYDKEVKALQGKTHDYKRKKHVPIKPKQGFLATAVWEWNMKHVKHDDKNLSKALKFAKRLYFSMKFCLLVTVALDIFIKERNNTLYIYIYI